MLMNYPGINPEASTKPEDAVKFGLGQAKDIMGQAAARQYDFPDWYGGQMQAPGGTVPAAQMQQYSVGEYTKPAGTSLGDMNRIDMPTYTGLMGQDYNRLESSLRDPAMQQIGERFGRSNAASDMRMGAGGMYGSSVDADMMNERARAQAMAESQAINQATAQRYGLQSQDLANMNQFNLGATGLGMQQEQNVWGANLQEALRKDAQTNAQNQFNLSRAGLMQGQAQNLFGAQMAGLSWEDQQKERARTFQNQQLADQANWGLMGNQYQQGLDDTAFNRAMSMATGSMPTYNAQIQADASRDTGLMEALGALGGGYLGGVAQGGSWNPLNWIK